VRDLQSYDREIRWHAYSPLTCKGKDNALHRNVAVTLSLWCLAAKDVRVGSFLLLFCYIKQWSVAETKVTVCACKWWSFMRHFSSMLWRFVIALNCGGANDCMMFRPNLIIIRLLVQKLRVERQTDMLLVVTTQLLFTYQLYEIPFTHVWNFHVK
jgi:hypothetical protein